MTFPLEISTIIYGHKEAVNLGLIPSDFEVPYVRIVKFGDSTCPCTGTHIHSLKEIK